MMKNLDAIIENYLTGNLSPDEVTGFEQFLSSNPAAQEQLELQQDIIESIKQTRRMELKSKLSSMSPAIKSSAIGQKMAIAAATLIGTALVSIGIYSASYNRDEETITASELPKTENTVESFKVINEVKSIVIEQADEEIETIDENSSTESLKEPVSNSNNLISSNTKKTNEAVSSNNGVSNTSKWDDLVKNEIDDENDNIHSNDDNSPNGFSENSVNANSATVKVEIDTNCSNEGNGYTYTDGKLQLCGDFKESEFTIYKDTKKGTFYFGYKNDYYKIEESNKFEKFSSNKLYNQRVINRLTK